MFSGNLRLTNIIIITNIIILNFDTLHEGYEINVWNLLVALKIHFQTMIVNYLTRIYHGRKLNIYSEIAHIYTPIKMPITLILNIQH
jgi:hypothetical protein